MRKNYCLDCILKDDCSYCDMPWNNEEDDREEFVYGVDYL